MQAPLFSVLNSWVPMTLVQLLLRISPFYPLLISTSSMKWLDSRLTQKKKLAAHLYTKDKWAEIKIREIIPVTIATININYLGVTLIKQVKDLYSKNFNYLMKETGENIRRWNDPPCCRISMVSIVKVTLPKAIYRFDSNPIKIPAQLITDL